MSAPLPNIDAMIVSLRGHNILLDEDLADLYGVPVKRMNEQVRRNVDRFPADFMFRLTAEETHNLRSQIATSSSIASVTEDAASKSHVATSKGHGGRRFLPYAFTEQGVAMLSSVLRSPRAVAKAQWFPSHKWSGTKVDVLDMADEMRHVGQPLIVGEKLRGHAHGSGWFPVSTIAQRTKRGRRTTVYAAAQSVRRSSGSAVSQPCSRMGIMLADEV